MGLLKQIIPLFCFILLISMVNCNEDPLLTDMKTSKLIVIMKGTYESNSPMPWNMPAVDMTDGSQYRTYMQDDSVYECVYVTDPLPTVFMFDAAELRLWDTQGNSYKFANYRQSIASGLNDSDPMFNGMGYALSNDDVPSKSYLYAAIYIRKMLIDSSASYFARPEGWYRDVTWDIYKENAYPVYNFNSMQVYSHYDTLRIERAGLNRIYPLLIPINNIQNGGSGMMYNNSGTNTVLEIRLVVKNYIKKYEQKLYNPYEYSVRHYYAFSDWLNDVEINDFFIGGNVLAVARTYVPELVGRISGTAPAGRHVIAIPAGANIANYTLNRNPYGAAVAPSNTLRSNNPCNLPRYIGGYTGTDAFIALDYFLDAEKYKLNWNDKITTCSSYDTYVANWDLYAGEANTYSIPDLAVFSSGASYTIENVMPGVYDVYYANKAPVYGQMYYDGEFIPLGTATVTTGSTAIPAP